MGHGDELHFQQAVTEKPGRDSGANDQIGSPLEQRLIGTGEDHLIELHPRPAADRHETLQGGHEITVGKRGIHHQFDLPLPALLQTMGQRLQLRRIVYQLARAA